MGRLKGVALATALLLAIVAAARGDVVGGANVRVSFRGWLTPRTLPRGESAPVTLHVTGSLRAIDGGDPPVLDRVTIAINRHGRISTQGLAVCRLGSIVASTTRQALATCGDALVGTGSFSAHIDIPEEAPFPARGTMLAFNAISHGHHVILAHVYGRNPVPTGQVMTLTFQRPQHGTFGTILSLKLPELAAEWGHVSGFSLALHRLYRYRGRTRSVISASCPAPRGFSAALFPAARGTYFLGDGRVIRRLVSGRCRVDTAHRRLAPKASWK